MNVFELMATLGLDSSEYEEGLERSENEGKSRGEKIKGVFSTIAKVSTAALTASATAVSFVTKAGVGAYAQYEQLSGGMDALFGEAAAGRIKRYAQMAYQTAGMSANEYMSTVTSFSASLIKSLAGDTQAAAQAANRAITDMGDNANRFGTSMESLQNAYAGFAKENYTMLDNLSLGYAGTKEGMQALIQDAAKLTDVQAELGVTVDENSMSFANIVNAISVVQKNMGIMGTTSAEAATTISGSWGMLKASWSNLLTGMADESQAVGPLITQVMSSAMTFGGNLIPRIQQTLVGVGEAIEVGLPKVLEKLPDVIGSLAPGLLSAAVSLLSSIGTAIVQQGPSLLQSAVDVGEKIILGISSGFADGVPKFLSNALPALVEFTGQLRANAGQLIDAGLEFALRLAEGIANGIPTIIENIPQIIINIAGIINDNAPKLLMTGLAIIVKLGEGLINAIPTLLENIPKIFEAILSVWTAINWVDLGLTIVDGIVNAVVNLPSTLKGIADNAVTWLKESFLGGGIESVVNGIFTRVNSFITQPIRSAIDTVKAVVNTVTNPFQTSFDKAVSIVRTAINKIKGFFNFSWSLPHIKLPHFSVSGSKNPIDWLTQGVPHISVSWYAKAMKNAMVLDGATIFGMAGGNLLGGGEAGREIISGEAHLLDLIDNAIYSRFAPIYQMMESYFPVFAEGLQIDGNRLSKNTYMYDRENTKKTETFEAILGGVK